MIPQPILATATNAKPPAQSTAHPAQHSNAAGFQSLLSLKDSSLTDLAQNVGANAVPPASPSKSKGNDPTGAAYVAAPNQPPHSPAPPSDGNQPAVDPNAAPKNAVVPASDTADDQSGNGNSTAFGADELNARIVAGAPIYSSQPSAAMATVPPHLLDAIDAHPLQGEALGKLADEALGKAPSEANANPVLPPTANAPNTPAALALTHAAVAAPNADTSSDKGDAPPQTADNGAASSTGNDPAMPNASPLAQSSAPPSAPVQVEAAVHTAAPYVPVGEQVALNLKQAIVAEHNEIRLQLKPASLGTIDVKLNVGQDGRINAVISADRSDTLNMLKQDAGTLQQALRDAGLNADSSSLSFNLRGDAQSFAQGWTQGGRGNGGGDRYGGVAGGDLLGAETITPATRVHSGALDIEV